MSTQRGIAPRLRPAFDDQDRRFGHVVGRLKDGAQQQVYPGAVLAVNFKGSLVVHKAVGRFTHDIAAPAVKLNTAYDLASLTKVVATTTMAMLLFERGRFGLDTPLVEILPEFGQESDSRRQRVTMRMLLAHSSGLPMYAPLYQKAQDREAMIAAACAVPLEAEPGTSVGYSDVGFILLGVALERLAGDPLNRFCQQEIFEPLGMLRACFTPPPGWRDSVPPTEISQPLRPRVIQGEVQDENAAAMGGIAGHSGLFACAQEVAVFAECILNGGSPILKPETVELFTQRETTPPGTSRTLGWDTPSAPSQSGHFFPSTAFGHLGFTGTSLWIDPDRRLAVTLLTNRTWPDRKSEAIKQLRPLLHNSIIETLK
jgi:CubicO group peptidase (beta-lactamase class C family)